MSLPRIEDLYDGRTLEQRLARATPGIRGLIDRVLDEGTLTVDEGVELLESQGDDVLAIIAARSRRLSEAWVAVRATDGCCTMSSPLLIGCAWQ